MVGRRSAFDKAEPEFVAGGVSHNFYWIYRDTMEA